MPRRPGQPPRRRMPMWAAALLLAATWVVLLPLPAQAHAALVSSSPSDGAVVASAPTEVTFTFDETVMAPAYVVVKAPDGSNVVQGSATISGATVTQAVRLVPQQGAYSASYRVVSDDGHPVQGTIDFTVDPAHAATARASTSPLCSGDCTSTPVWQRESTWVVIALAALAMAISLVFALGLRSGSDATPGGDG
jgi:methionine-rich copper-binding protein CopC